MRIPFAEMKAQIKRAMKNAGLSEEQAEICAQVHTESSLEGVQSHGLNRVPRFIDYVNKGWVDVNGRPELLKAVGCAENYDGHLGIGIINAKFAMGRAMELAKLHGIGMVGLRNTTHWMRGGSYAWDAARAGYMAICWTNTESCMPAWGSKAPCVGNNPLCIAIPRGEAPLVLDMAMSQYAYGKLQVTRLAGEKLPFAGGFDSNGNLTDDPGKIEESQRILPTGYWKGSGLAIALDMAASILSNGLSTGEIDQVGKGSCGNCCQVFLAFDPNLFGTAEEVERHLDATVACLHNAPLAEDARSVTYPGERTQSTRERNEREGILADESVWAQVCAL